MDSTDFYLGMRAEFVQNGETISGEVVMIDNETNRVAIYRDERWRTADAAFTWMPAADATPL